ncbi:MAG TPA: RNA polymerase sigma factor [Kofleriaceae bacterium]|jgi:RNA polymerase sigma-70 factor (ECF subfamily)
MQTVIGAQAMPSSADDLAASRRAELADMKRLYDAEASYIRRAVVHLGGMHADVDDLVHDVFVVAVRRRDAFDGRSSARTWLYGITVKVVAAWRRRQRLRRFFGLSELAKGDEPVDPFTPARYFARGESVAVAYRILDQMSEHQRTVFILFELEELSGEAIAKIIERPVKTVWTRLFRARAEFERRLRQLTGEPS